ncbi:mechanosensitive ion channel family protein [Patescibacteria group bacterium]|nr:mechanosensitive ion channel family protein [Patescibacteria group bacterium]
MITKRKLTGVVFCFIFILPMVVFAQEEAKTIDENILKDIYQQYLKTPEDEFILKRIEDERSSIRDFIEEELQKVVAPPPEEAEIDPSEITKALDRQKVVIASLQERLRERKVDLELLDAEEEKFYLSPSGDTGALLEAGKFRITKTHEGLLAKKAILEERISVLNSLLYQQNERLAKLTSEQKMLQFSTFIIIGKYLLVLLLIWILEKLIRMHLLSLIKHDDKRYTVTKIFSSTVYIITIAWIAITLFAKNPGVLASFAIVGAGLAIALQDVVKDVVGWVVIIQNRLFSTGDRVTIGNSTGEVVDIDVLRTKLLEVGIPPEGVLEHTGKILSIPNSKVLAQNVTNHNTTSDFVNSEVHITITFESDWKKAKKILEDILKEETDEFTEREKIQQIRRTRSMYIRRQVIGARVYMEVADDGIMFILRFPVPIGERRIVVSGLSERVMNALDSEPNVELAYKTMRYYKRGE